MNDRITINKTTKSVANEACIFFGWHDCIVYTSAKDGKTSRSTVEANTSKIQGIKGGKFHQK